MKVIFCGGGTAGHVNPAVAMGEILQKKYKNLDLLYIGRKDGPENSAIKKAGFRLKCLDVCGFKRNFSRENLKAVNKAYRAFYESKKIIKEFSPDLIIGTGGYVSWPMLYAGYKLKIKTLIHESNAFPGLVTKIMQKKCDRVLLNIETTKKYLKKNTRTLVIGTPVRKEFEYANRKKARQILNISDDEIFIVSFGGSNGAKKINDTCINLFREYSAKNPKIKHIHGVGRKNFQNLKEEDKKFCNGISTKKIVPYIENMPIVLTAADIAITRSGAVTITELAKAKVPAILIPSPNVTENHQYINAKAISDNNGAILIEESELTNDLLIEKVKELTESEEKRNVLSQNISKFSSKNFEDIFQKTIKEVINEI